MIIIYFLFLLIGPRFTSVMWWLINPARFEMAFSSFIWPILGILFMPWTTLMYVGIFPGGITGWDWLWMGLAVLADLATHANSARKVQQY